MHPVILAANTLTLWRNFRCIYVQFNLTQQICRLWSTPVWRIRYST